MKTRYVSVSIAALAITLAAGTAAAQTAYAVGNGGQSLIRFNVNDPMNVSVVANFSGDNMFLDAIDFRPATGQLYGYLDSADSFYTVDVNTGALTLATDPASVAPTNTFVTGLDFNPTIDRARLVTESTQNIVYNPNNGSTVAVTNVFYAAGDQNEGAIPNIIDNAYTQNFDGSTSTTQYAIDHFTNQLVTVANNAGTLNTVGDLGVDTGIFTGLDIFTDAGGNDTAYAILAGPNGENPGFYTVDLATGAASLIGDLGFGSGALGDGVYSLAIIPTPSGFAALGLAAALAAGRRRHG